MLRRRDLWLTRHRIQLLHFLNVKNPVLDGKSLIVWIIFLWMISAGGILSGVSHDALPCWPVWFCVPLVLTLVYLYYDYRAKKGGRSEACLKEIAFFSLPGLLLLCVIVGIAVWNRQLPTLIIGLLIGAVVFAWLCRRLQKNLEQDWYAKPNHAEQHWGAYAGAAVAIVAGNIGRRFLSKRLRLTILILSLSLVLPILLFLGYSSWVRFVAAKSIKGTSGDG